MRLNLRAGVCVGAAIFRGGRLLMLRRAALDPAFPGRWDIPGGSVEEGESLEDAIRREVLEETGFRVRVGAPYAASIFDATYGDTARRTPLKIVAVQFRCFTSARRAPRLDPKEHSEFAWVDRRDVARYPVPPSLIGPVRRAYVSRRLTR
ncbi:MAG: NUDIX domain-containing protein [Thermoplasmata archaeon]